MAVSVEKTTVTTNFPYNFQNSRPEEFFKIAVLKCLRKFREKTYVQKIKKDILPQIFSRKFTRIFQSNCFTEHFQVAVSLVLEVGTGGLLYHLRKIHRKTPEHLQGSLQLYLKRDCGSGVFL